MGNKVFISYKYSDDLVEQLRPHDFFHVTTARVQWYPAFFAVRGLDQGYGVQSSP